MSNDYGWWAGTSDEYMNIAGPLPTREEAIKAGCDDQCGDPFWICEARLQKWRAPDAETVLDMLIDQNDELWYDDGFPGFVGVKDIEKSAITDLQFALNNWLEKWRHMLPAPTAFYGATSPEYIARIEEKNIATQ